MGFPFVYAGVKKGDIIGSYEWYYDNRLVGDVPIVAQEDAEYNSPEKETQSIWERIKGFLFN